MLAAALQQYHALESQCETEIEEALRILVTPNYCRQGTQSESAESLALFQPWLVLYGGTREQAGGHGGVSGKSRQAPCCTEQSVLCQQHRCRLMAAAAQPARQWGTLGAASPWTLTQRGCTKQKPLLFEIPLFLLSQL